MVLFGFWIQRTTVVKEISNNLPTSSRKISTPSHYKATKCCGVHWPSKPLLTYLVASTRMDNRTTAQTQTEPTVSSVRITTLI